MNSTRRLTTAEAPIGDDREDSTDNLHIQRSGPAQDGARGTVTYSTGPAPTPEGPRMAVLPDGGDDCLSPAGCGQGMA